jgi:hypothetical protein
MLTPETTLRFGSLDCVYTGPVESVAGRTFGWPPRPNGLSGAVAREAFGRSYSGNVIISSWGQTRHRIVLGSPPIISPTSPSKLVETDCWTGGNSWSSTPQCTLTGNPACQTTRWQPTSTASAPRASSPGQ